MSSKPLKLAFLGATGRVGFALAVAHAKAGHHVILGSRDAARASEAVAKAEAQLAGQQQAGTVEGAELSAAAQQADVVFLVYGGYMVENKVCIAASSSMTDTSVQTGSTAIPARDHRMIQQWPQCTSSMQQAEIDKRDSLLLLTW